MKAKPLIKEVYHALIELQLLVHYHSALYSEKPPALLYTVCVILYFKGINGLIYLLTCSVDFPVTDGGCALVPLLLE